MTTAGTLALFLKSSCVEFPLITTKDPQRSPLSSEWTTVPQRLKILTRGLLMFLHHHRCNLKREPHTYYFLTERARQLKNGKKPTGTMLLNRQFALSHWGAVPGEEVWTHKSISYLIIEGMFLCHLFTVTREPAEEDGTVCKTLPEQNFSFPCS